MSYQCELLSIYADCGEFAVPARAWQIILSLGERYGWKPRGTAPPDELAIECGLWHGELADWDGRYAPAYGQQVKDADARALADALERALRDIPDHDALRGKVKNSRRVWKWFETTSACVEVNLIEAFSGANKGC
jgi:hypothetical protein